MLRAQGSFSSLELALRQDDDKKETLDEHGGHPTVEYAGGGYMSSEPRSYNIQSDLHILNEIPQAVWISKFDSADTRFVWGNIAALSLWNKPSLRAFTSTDIMSERSIAIQKTHQKLYQDVQVNLWSRIPALLYSRLLFLRWKEKR